MKIYSENKQKIKTRIENRDVAISVVGIGVIGLPVATYLANQGFTVFGIDRNEQRVKQVNAGNVHFEYSDMLKKVLCKDNFHATMNSEEALRQSDIAIVCVPTPLEKERRINLGYIDSATKSIIDVCPKGMALIYESSVPLGTTRSMGNRIEDATGLKLGKDFGLAHIPERYNPTLPIEQHPEIFVGQTCKHVHITHKLDMIPRIVGGIDEKSVSITKCVYSTFIKEGIKQVSSIEVAEASKLLENIFRDVNIALINEFALICSKIGIDAYEVIDAAKTKPFAFIPHYPGLVGGECIPIDTWYLIKQAEELGIDAKLMRVAREVNDYMAIYTVNLLKDALKEKNQNITKSKIGILGLAYKKNIADSRVSLSKTIKEILQNQGAAVLVCDPVIETLDPSNNIGLTSLDSFFEGLDGVIMATDHDTFSKIDWEEAGNVMRTRVAVDTRNFLDAESLKRFGFAYRGIGKPVE